VLAALPLLLQISIRPLSVTPAQHERIALRVANPSDTAVIAVRVEVPSVLTILGLDAPPGWTARLDPATDTTAQAIVWSGGALHRLEFREFAFLARPAADVKPLPLVFPVRLDRADGAVRLWGPGGIASAPTIAISTATGITPGGAFGLGAAGIGIALFALILALRRPAATPG